MTSQHESEAEAILGRVLDLAAQAGAGAAGAGAGQAEVLFFASDSALTRFSNSSIHQNVAETGARVSVRVALGSGGQWKIGTAATDRVDDPALQRLVSTAVEAAKLSPPDREFPGLPGPKTIPKVDSFFEATARYGPDARADDVAQIVARANESGLSAAGAVSTDSTVVGVANSLGTKAAVRLTSASIHTLLMADHSSGYADAVSRDVRRIDARALAETAARKAVAAAGPVAVEPGRYTVILEPDAAADMLSFLSFVGFGALALQEKRSFMAGKLGEPVMGDNITIWDDALDPRTLTFPFDFEGVPKQKVAIIEGGVAVTPVYDSETAAREGKESTGHALPAPNTYGPQAGNLFMKTGEAARQEMIESVDRGILVTRFHYTNVEDPIKTILTGMTRDGTFLIEGGRLTKGVKNLRFTQSIVEALSNVETISTDAELKKGILGAVYAPALLIHNFNFTGVSEL